MKAKLLLLTATALAALPAAVLAQGSWLLTGNSGTIPGTDFLGTTDTNALELKVNGSRALRLEPYPDSPSIVGGYFGNQVSNAAGATISGGGSTNNLNLIVKASFGTIGGGIANTISNRYGTICGGLQIVVAGDAATVGGGQGNRSDAGGATIGGGIANHARGSNATAGGGKQNDVAGDSATVAGGESNTAEDDFSFVGGGRINIARGTYSVVGGGLQNIVNAYESTIGGGSRNTIESSAWGSSIGGGEANTIKSGADKSTIGGGGGNTIYNNAELSTIGGGFSNIVHGAVNSIGGGALNTVLGGQYATIPGGYRNFTSGNYSFAAGRRARSNQDGAFVWADSTDDDFSSTSENQFLIRAAGGVGIGKNNPQASLDVAGNAAFSGNVGVGTTTPQAKLDVVGKVLCQVLELSSDRNLKGGFESVSARDVLEKVANLPLSTWHYTNAPCVRHIGPMAQDFKTTFGVGSDDKHIATVDADGVALAAIQGLHELIQEKDTRIATLEKEVATLRQDIAARIAALENMMAQTEAPPSTSRTTHSETASFFLSAPIANK